MKISYYFTHFGGYWVWLILTGLILAGADLRLYDIGRQPYWMDESYTINAVLAISEKSESVLDSGLPYVIIEKFC